MLDLPTKDTFKLICEMPNIEELIVRSDTSYDYPNYKEHTIRSFDKKNRLIQVFKSNLFESNTKKIYSETVIYDTAGRIIYEDKTKQFTRWHYYCYKFDTNGNMIYKEGYSSGEMGLRVSFMYENGKLVKEISERGGRKIEKIY